MLAWRAYQVKSSGILKERAEIGDWLSDALDTCSDLSDRERFEPHLGWASRIGVRHCYRGLYHC